MATIRAYTTIEQSKKLAEILPLESADMYWWSSGKRYYIEAMDDGDFNEEEGHIRAWSLAALLGVLPEPYQLTSNKEGKVQLMLIHHLEKDYYDNPIDACVDMILKLHKLNLL
jgi:hypothetical protein